MKKILIFILPIIAAFSSFGFCYAETPYIIDDFINWGYLAPKKDRTIDAIIVHSSYDAFGKNPYSVTGVVWEYKIYGVSPHYLISRKGNIYQLVNNKYIAFHAGWGKYPGTDNVINMNDSSIGIEMIYLDKESPNKAQYQSLSKLVNYLKSKYQIEYILGHNQTSISGKTDPWNFDWKKFQEISDETQ